MTSSDPKSADPDSSDEDDRRSSPSLASSIQDPKNKHLGSWALLCYLVRSFSVEPAIFFVVGGFSVFGVISVPALSWKVCEQLFFNDTSIDCRKPQNLTRSAETLIQQTTATWNVYGPLATFVPLLFIGPIYGALGDRYGRKYNILISLVGLVIMAALQSLMFRFEMMPLWIGPVVSLVIACTGFIGTFSTSAYAYVSDETQDPDLLTYRVTFLAVMSGCAQIIFGFVTASVVRTWDYYQTMFIPLSLWSAAFIYTLFFLHQVPPKQMAEYQKTTKFGRKQKLAANSTFAGASKDGATFGLKEQHANNGMLLVKAEDTKTSSPFGYKEVIHMLKQIVTESVQTITKKRHGQMRLYIWSTLFAFFILSACFMGIYLVLNLFAMRKPIAWTAQDMGYYSSFNSVLGLVGTALGTCVMKRWLSFHESSMLIVALVSNIARFLILAFSWNGAMLYASSVLGLVGGLTFPICKALVVHFIDRDEVGKIYSLFQISRDLSIMFAFGGFNILYTITVGFFAGTVFLIIASITSLALVLVVFVHIGFKRHRMRELLQQADSYQ